MTDYASIWEHAEGLPWVALVTTGRVGSDFLQSLLDGHPELFVFNGHLFFHDWWQQSYVAQAGPEAADLAEEFTGHFLHKLKSRYDKEENKDGLGEEQDQSLDLDPAEFKRHLMGLLEGRPVTSRRFLTAIYVAYALSLGQDPFPKKVFIHHIHHIWRLPDYVRDFPESRLLAMTRDPRAAWVSGVEHWVPARPVEAHAWTVWFTLERAFRDVQELHAYGNEFRALRLETLGDRATLEALCAWLGVSYDAALERSTWGGLRWWGDQFSSRKPKREEQGFSPTVVRNRWQEKLPARDRRLLEFLMAPRLRHYGYAFEPQGGLAWLRSFWQIPLPLAYERRYAFPAARQSPKQALKVLYYYARRVASCYRLWWARVKGKGYVAPFIAP